MKAGPISARSREILELAIDHCVQDVLAPTAYTLLEKTRAEAVEVIAASVTKMIADVLTNAQGIAERVS